MSTEIEHEVREMAEQPKDAPGELNLVRSFVNTLDIDDGVETLDSPASLCAWLLDHDLLDRPVEAGTGDLARAITLREALRELLLRNNDRHAVDESAPRALDDVAARAKLRLRATPEGATKLEAEAAGVDGALGRLLIIVYRAMETGTWPRLKVCRNDTCRWAFYDRSRNRSGHWCSMDSCGSVMKARTYRLRKRTATASDAALHDHPARERTGPGPGTGR